jgi:sugar lactone lactonase YvrE
MSERARQTLPVGAIAYPEAPRWYRDALWFSDVHNFRLMRCGLAGDPTVVAEVPGRPSGMGVTPDGRLLLATAMEKALHWVEDDGLVAAVDLAPLTSGLLNDMIVDAQGRAYVGDTGYDLGAGASPAPGRILVWDGDDKPRSVVEDVTFPNGMAITPDGKTLYVAETFAERVSAFDIGRDGDLSGRRVHAVLPGTPDGLCLDADGALWIACLLSGAFLRVDRHGAIVDRVDVSPYRAVACVLGGADRRTLFLCQAFVDDSDPKQPRRTGRIEWLTVPVAGAGLP